MTDITKWTVVDVFDLIPHEKIVITIAMIPFRVWCAANLGQERNDRGDAQNWYNDLYHEWYEIYFKNPDDAVAFILKFGGTIKENEVQKLYTTTRR